MYFSFLINYINNFWYVTILNNHIFLFYILFFIVIIFSFNLKVVYLYFLLIFFWAILVCFQISTFIYLIIYNSDINLVLFFLIKY